MDIIEQFFLNFGQYCINAKDGWGYCILIPAATLAAIWGITFVGLKIFAKRDKLRTVFLIHRTIIAGSLIVAMALVAMICYWWSKNIFAGNNAELAFLISLVIAFVVPIVSFAVLRIYWEKSKVNNIAGQPVSAYQAEKQIAEINKSFYKNKVYYLMPLIGFLFLLFSLNSGRNLISIVFDNSVSMDLDAATSALTKTFDRLNENNEIIFTNLNNTDSDLQGCKKNLKEILAIKQSNKIKVGLCSIYNTPEDAKQNFQSTISTAAGSPICEVIWKMWLFTKETKINDEYKNKLLIVITDGDDLITKADLQQNNKFFFDDAEFSEYYTTENTYIIDYSQAGNGVVIKKFEDNGVTIYPAVTSMNDYLDALDGVLATFQRNDYLIGWMAAIYVIFTIIGLFITPKKITI
jgi:hypothetical protein